MNISKHISDLIYRHDCVVIPSLGAVVSRRIPANHDDENHTIYPPKKHVGFNSSIQESDGLLINYVASVEGITYEQSEVEVSNYVIKATAEIHSIGYFNIHKVGQLKKTAEGNLLFSPVNVVNYLPESFGLSMQSAYPTVHEDENEPVVIPPVVEPTGKSEESEKNGGFYLWRVAAGIALLAVLTFFGYRSYQEQTELQNAQIAEQAAKQFEDRVQESTFNITAPLPTINLEVEPLERTHHIIAGAFRNPANADKRVAQLKAKGYNARRIGVNKYGLHNVAFASYVERDDAINELYRLRKEGYQSAWLFTGTLPKS